MSAVLEAKNISCGYGKNRIIKNVSFVINEGEFTGIIGPNGSGKTTLLRAITKTLKLQEGKVNYRNQSLHKISYSALAREVAVLPQNLDVPFNFTVEEFVLMGRFPHLKRFQSFKQSDFDKSETVMKNTGVLHLKKRGIYEISGGERQRVLIAQALAQEPKILILDEPTAHLDIGQQVDIMDLIKNLSKKNNLTVISVLHDLNLASEYCTKLMLLDKGVIYRYGDVKDVLTYKTIEEVYKTLVIVNENPITGKPHILLVSKK